MGGLLSPVMIGGIVGAVAGGLAVVAYCLLQPQRQCPDCGERFPKFRKPQTGRQAMWGGWTCQKCGCEVDRKGNRIER